MNKQTNNTIDNLHQALLELNELFLRERRALETIDFSLLEVCIQEKQTLATQIASIQKTLPENIQTELSNKITTPDNAVVLELLEQAYQNGAINQMVLDELSLQYQTWFQELASKLSGDPSANAFSTFNQKA